MIIGRLDTRTRTGYEADLKKARAGGRRLLSSTAYRKDGQQYFGYVLFDDPEKLEWEERHDMTLAQLRQEHAAFVTKGYRPTIISACSTDKGTQYLALWVHDPKSTTLPCRGREVPELATLEQVVTQFMEAHSIPAGSLAVIKNGRLVLARGYGYLDRDRKRPVEPDTPFRLASLTKGITNAAIRKLVSEGKLRPDTPVFPLLGLEPLPGAKRDPRLDQITVDHLLDHKGGWDSALAGDPMFRLLDIAETLRKPSPPSATDIIRYVMGKPLQFEPGARSAYSNFGYCVLGRVVEKVSGQAYMDYVQKEITAPLGITTLELGRTLPRDRNPREPYYTDAEMGPSVVEPLNKTPVPEPDGTFCMESMDSHGGLICSAPDFARFLEHYQLNGDPVRPNRVNGNFYGSLPGTTALAIHHDDLRIVALFDKRILPVGASLDKLRDQLLLAARAIDRWPTAEVSDRTK